MTADPRVPELLQRAAAAAQRAAVLRDRVTRVEQTAGGTGPLTHVGLALAAGSVVLPWGYAARPREHVLAAGLLDVERYAAIAPLAMAFLAVGVGITWVAVAMLPRRQRYGYPAVPLGATALVGVPAANVLTAGAPTVGGYLALVGLALTAAALVATPWRHRQDARHSTAA